VELFLNWQLRLAAGDLVFNNIPTPRSWKADGRRHIPPNRLLLVLCLGPHASAPPVVRCVLFPVISGVTRAPSSAGPLRWLLLLLVVVVVWWWW